MLCVRRYDFLAEKVGNLTNVIDSIDSIKNGISYKGIKTKLINKIELDQCTT